MEPRTSALDGSRAHPAAHVSIGVIAWNEEEAIASTLRSALAQSLFADLSARKLRCELFCVANGCTDQTAAIALELFKEQAVKHPYAEAVLFHVVELKERGKVPCLERICAPSLRA